MRGDPKFNDKTNITISIDGQIGKEIKQIAKKQGQSTNAIVNKVLKDYVMFGKYFQDHTPIVMSPDVFSLFLKEVDEKILLKTWDFVFEQVVIQVFAMHNLEHTLENLLNHLLADICTRVGVFSKFTCHKSKTGYKLIMEHEYDDKWSRVLGSSLSKSLEKSFDTKVSFQAMPNTLSMDVKVI